jgi:hypothetical protein
MARLLLLAGALLLLSQAGCAAGCDPPRRMVQYQALDGAPNYKCVAEPPAPNAARRQP